MPDSFPDLAGLRFAWHIPGKLAGSSMPGLAGNLEQHLRLLQREGIKVIISLTGVPLVLPRSFENVFTVMHAAMEDGEPPSLDQMEKILDTVSISIETGLPCLVHCAGGIGRSGTILAALMMRLSGLSLDKALFEIAKAGRRPQTIQQINFLKQWAEEK